MGECRQLGTSSRPTGPFAVELRLEPPIQTEPNRLKRFNRLLGFPIEGEPTYKKFEEWLEIDYKKEHRVNKDVAEMIYGLIEEEKGQA